MRGEDMKVFFRTDRDYVAVKVLCICLEVVEIHLLLHIFAIK